MRCICCPLRSEILLVPFINFKRRSMVLENVSKNIAGVMVINGSRGQVNDMIFVYFSCLALPVIITIQSGNKANLSTRIVSGILLNTGLSIW